DGPHRAHDRARPRAPRAVPVLGRPLPGPVRRDEGDDAPRRAPRLGGRHEGGLVVSEGSICEALHSASDTEAVVIGEGVLDGVADVFADAFGDGAAVVVADGHTWDVAGAGVHERLADAGREVRDPYRFPATPTLYAGYDNIQTLIEALRDVQATPVAV